MAESYPISYAEYLAFLYGLCREGVEPHGAIYEFFHTRQLTELRADGKAWANARGEAEYERRVSECMSSVAAMMLLVAGIMDDASKGDRLVDKGSIPYSVPRQLFEQLCDREAVKYKVMHHAPGGGSSDASERMIYLPAPGDYGDAVKRTLTDTDSYIIGLHELGHIVRARAVDLKKLAAYNIMRTMHLPVPPEAKAWIIERETEAWLWADQYKAALGPELATAYDELREGGLNSYRSVKTA